MPTGPGELLQRLASFDWAEWSTRLRADIEPLYRDVVLVSGRAVLDGFDLDDPFTSNFMTSYVGERIVQLDAFTKENVSDLLRRILDREGGGKSTLELAKIVRREVRQHVAGYHTWRAHRIARTETAYAYNHGAVLGAHQAGVTHMNVTDGDRDEPCASANGQVWTIAECLANSLGHPNCTRAFSPVA